MTHVSRPLRWGAVGGGDSTSVGELHRNALRLNGDTELVAGVFSHDREKSKCLGAELGVDEDRIYPSAEVMAQLEAERADGIDFVDISTPNAFHYPAAKAFLEQGINVACEKPLCLTPEEGEELERIAVDTGALFCLMHTFTGHAMSREARALYEEGVIGELRTVVVEYPQDWLVDALERETDQEKTWRSIPELSGRGAAIGDIGSHMENWVHYVTGLRVTKVLANLEALGAGSMLDNNFQVIARFENGSSSSSAWSPSAELGVHTGGVGLVVDRVKHRFDGRPQGLGCDGHQIRGVVGSATLPGGAWQVRRDRLDESLVGVTGDQAHPGQAAGDEVGEETVPRRPGLRCGHAQAEASMWANTLAQYA